LRTFPTENVRLALKIFDCKDFHLGNPTAINYTHCWQIVFYFHITFIPINKAAAKNGYSIPPSPEKSEHSKTTNKVLTNSLLKQNVGWLIFAIFSGSHNLSLPSYERMGK
jgi:hypothetical protein